MGDIVVACRGAPVFGADLFADRQCAGEQGRGVLMPPLRRKVEGKAVIACRDVGVVRAQGCKTGFQRMTVKRFGLEIAAARGQVAGNVVFDAGKLRVVVVHCGAADLERLVIQWLRLLVAPLSGKVECQIVGADGCQPVRWAIASCHIVERQCVDLVRLVEPPQRLERCRKVVARRDREFV